MRRVATWREGHVSNAGAAGQLHVVSREHAGASEVHPREALRRDIHHPLQTVLDHDTIPSTAFNYDHRHWMFPGDLKTSR